MDNTDTICGNADDVACCPAGCTSANDTDCPAVCGDTFCTHDETAESCEDDCPAVCGDDLCTHDETARTCYDDCGTCGDDECAFGYEDSGTCSDDCTMEMITNGGFDIGADGLDGWSPADTSSGACGSPLGEWSVTGGRLRLHGHHAYGWAVAVQEFDPVRPVSVRMTYELSFFCGGFYVSLLGGGERLLTVGRGADGGSAIASVVWRIGVLDGSTAR